MLFKPEHIPMILNGNKTATRRDWKKQMVIVGNSYPVKTKMLSKETHCKIKILKVYKQKLYDMKNEDAKKEGYSNLKEFEKIWIEINGDWNSRQTGNWNGNKEVYVIEFQLDEQKGTDGGNNGIH